MKSVTHPLLALIALVTLAHAQLAEAVTPFFNAPFDGQHPISNIFDHAFPFQFDDHNGFLLSFWGEALPGTDGHDGYDWVMPESTPIRAVADGTVVFAGREDSFYCPLLDQNVRGNTVVIEHQRNGVLFQTVYAHFSEVLVQVGEHVGGGYVIGLSGTTGCSTGPHLHFETRVLKNNRWISVDPYGWRAKQADPWSGHPEGATSTWLWLDGQAPLLFRQFTLFTTDDTPVRITRVQYMGVGDMVYPNNEFVEITINPVTAPQGLDLGNYRLRTSRGRTFTFPLHFTLQPGAPLRVYAGSGNSSSRTLFWGNDQGVLDNSSDCIQLLRPDGTVAYRLQYGNNPCR